jgi:S-adenosylmethionine decarboxylase proenzyme
MHNFQEKITNFPILNYPHALGTEIILEFFDCVCEFMSDVDTLKNAYNLATTRGNLTVVNEHYHKFDPIGVSLCITLAESSICTHTYPEYNYAAINLFYCGKDVKIEDTIQTLYEFYKPGKIDIKSFPRGVF